MPELDFSKIFGETATSKASFTNENYLNGWGYLGSTPPPYQLFDYLQSINDKKSKYLYDSINENKNNLLGHNTDERAHSGLFQKVKTELATHNADSSAHSGLFQKVKTELATHNADSSAHSGLFQKVKTELATHDADSSAHSGLFQKVKTELATHNADSSAHSGLFQKVKTELATHNTDSSAHTPILNAIKAISGMSAYDIAPSKTIDAIIPLLGFGGIVAQKLETNGYVKFANGFCIQWGNAWTPITFPIAFPTAALNVVATLQVDGDSGNLSKNRLYIQTLTTNGFSIQNPQGTYRYYAVGY